MLRFHRFYNTDAIIPKFHKNNNDNSNGKNNKNNTYIKTKFESSFRSWTRINISQANQIRQFKQNGNIML